MNKKSKKLYIWNDEEMDDAWIAEVGPAPTRQDDERLEAAIEAEKGLPKLKPEPKHKPPLCRCGHLYEYHWCNHGLCQVEECDCTKAD